MRRWFRWCRITVLLLVLVALVAGLFLNKVGLPEFLKRRLVAQLRAQGWDVEFSRMRLRWSRGLVAENIHFQRTNTPAGPNLFVEEAQFRVDHEALKRRQFVVDTLRLNQGRLIWPLEGTNQPKQTVSLENIQGELRLKTNDLWELRSFQLRYHGASVRVSGALTNASAMRDWRFPRRTSPAPATGGDLLNQIERALDQLKFARAPELIVQVRGDARDYRSFSATLDLTAAALSSSWGAATNLTLSAQWIPPVHSNDSVQVELNLGTAEARTPWGGGGLLRLHGQFAPSLLRPMPSQGNWELQLDDARTPWGSAGQLLVTSRFHPAVTNEGWMHTELKVAASQLQISLGGATNARLTALVAHPLTNWRPAAISGELRLAQTQSRWGGAQAAQVNALGELPPAAQLRLFQTNLTWPERLETIPLSARVLFTHVDGPYLQMENAAVQSHWRFPALRLEGDGRLYDGQAGGRAELNATNRFLTFTATSDFDVERISPLLTTNAQTWLSQFHWQTAPRLESTGRVTLPAWTNRHPDWRGEVSPTLVLEGRFEVGPGLFRGLPFNAARSPFALSNQVWRLPELKVTREEGELLADYTSDQRARVFHALFSSTMDPKILGPLLEKETARPVLGLFDLSAPPFIQAEISGPWRGVDRLAFTAQLAITNFSFRGETVKDATVWLQYSNKFLSFVHPQVQREGERATAEGVGVDFEAQKLYLTNATGNLNAYALTRAIGRAAARAIEPYVFDVSPSGRVNGVVDLNSRRHEDNVRFEVAGGPFHWKRFNLEQIAGRIDWVGETVTLTNIHGQLHGGRIDGWAGFDFSGPVGSDFRFQLAATEIILPSLIAGLSHQTNRLEGVLNGELAVTNANTEELKSWQGWGRVDVRDTLIWDIPVFGVFSPILNLVMPGLGHSRAKEAKATFTITNGVVFSKDLEIHATAMRMQYEGAVDFERRVEGKMEAELLRDVPLAGPLLSKLFWPVTKLFEYRIHGTLDQPKTEPLYIVPKLLLLPLHPFRTLKGMFPEEKKNE